MDDVRYEHHLKHRGRANRRIAGYFWVAVCAAVFAIWVQRALKWGRRRYYASNAPSKHKILFAWLRRRAALVRSISLISLPLGHISLGHILALTAYMCIIVSMLLSVDAPTFTFHFTDDVAFRAAWTTVSQIPLVYLLSAKRGPLNYLTALSYERINWLHRWVGRMIFVSATTHMAIMLSSIPVSDLIRSHEDGIQVVRYGVGAYILLLWIAVSSVIGVRKRWHRFFYVNHWISTIIFLGLAFNHVPSYARLPIYASITLIVADKTLVGFSYMLKNMTVRPVRTKFRKFRRSTSKSRELHVLAMGHPVKMVVPIIPVGSAASAESTTVIRISDLPFKWKPGQHVRMWLPRLGSLEVHPFTPATCSNFLDQRAPESQDAEEHGLLPTDSMEQDNDMILMIKAHDGLTKRLADYRDEWRSLPCPNASQPSSSLVAFLDGPYGNTPAWEEYESILMLSTSTGVSFMLSILNYLEYLSFANDGRLRTRQIRFVWANRHVEPVFEAMVTELLCKNSIALRDSGVLVEADFYITCAESKEQPSNPDMSNIDLFAHLRPSRGRSLIGKPPLRIRNPNDPDDWEDSDDESTHTFQNSPLTSDDEASRSSEDTYVEGRSDEQRPCLADLELAIDEVEPSYWSRFKIPRWTRKSKKSVEACQCAMLRHQEQNRKGKKYLPFSSRQYGVRPDIDAVLSSAVPSTSLAKTMVTVCGTKIGHDARKTASRINMDYAMKKRETGVHFWAESMT